METENEIVIEATDVQEVITNKIECDDYFAPTQKKLEHTQEVRETLKTKLMDVIQAVSFKIDPNEKALQTQAKISIIHKAAELLNDMDSQTFQFEKLKLSKKDNDINENQNKLVADFLLKFNPNITVSTTKTNVDEADKEIEKLMSNEEMAVLPGEVV